MLYNIMDISGNECIHCIIADYIDIDEDRSEQIFYCEKCFTTFRIEDMQMYNTISPDSITIIPKEENLQFDSENQ